MTEEPKPESPEDDAEFQRVLGNLLNTPHKPHVPNKPDSQESSRPEVGDVG